MKAYKVWVKGTEDLPEFSIDIVFANSNREAKKIAWKKGTVVREWADNFFDVRVQRYSCADWWAKLANRPGIGEDFFFYDPCFLRDVYYWGSDYPTCAHCLKSDLSELHPDPETRKILKSKWEVCEECESCRECGHSSDCSRKEPCQS